MKHKILYKSALLYLGLSTSLLSCKKLIEIDPPIDRIAGSAIYKDPTSATKVLTGIYYKMSEPESIFTGGGSLSVKLAYAADDLINASGTDHFYLNALSPDQDTFYWNELYSYIFSANAAIEGITASDAINERLKLQLIAEARFIRAFSYFYLVNLYGDVPLALTTNYKINGLLPRTPTEIVYQQIVADLLFAKSELSENYLAGDATSKSADRTRPNKAVASALLSRVYLFVEDWSRAEAEATGLLQQTDIYKLEPIENNFAYNSKESIWQLETTYSFRQTADGAFFIPGETLPELLQYLRPQLIAAFSDNDLRKKFYMKSFKTSNLYYPFKYKAVAYNPGEYLMVFRLAEQYLIRAEARAQLNKLTGVNSAQSDLNVVRSRAGLPDITSSAMTAVLDAVAQERRTEFFTEWGHRWFDLKRTDQIDAVLKEAKGAAWHATDKLLPIPKNELIRDKNLMQNPGY